MNEWVKYNHRKGRLIQIKSYLPRVKAGTNLKRQFQNLKYQIKKGDK